MSPTLFSKPDALMLGIKCSRCGVPLFSVRNFFNEERVLCPKCDVDLMEVFLMGDSPVDAVDPTETPGS